MSNSLTRLISFLERWVQLPNTLRALDAWARIHQTQIQNLSDSVFAQRAQLENSFAAKLAQLENSFAAKLAQLENSFATTLAQLENSFAAKLAQLENSFAAQTIRVESELSKISYGLSEERDALRRRDFELNNELNKRNTLLELGIPWLSDDPSLADDPEFLLLAFLYSALPSRIAIDVGANEGRLSKLLLETGYRVFAFEPYPPVLEKLRENLGENPEMTIFDCALGSRDTKLSLHIATVAKNVSIGDGSLYNTFRPHFVSEGVEFASQIEVNVRTLSSLFAEGALPKAISLLKIDTEGFDLEVIRGMGDLRPAVVQAEFWGDDFLFVRYEGETRPASSREIVSEMRSRGYWWNLIIFRIEGEFAIRFTSNLANAPKRAWGNILFFEHFDLFSIAHRWCQAALPRLQEVETPPKEASQ
jgi:FkbM family methyltransferase